MMADEMSETDQIERDLARTRERMDHRLDELQEKLAPAQLLNDAFATIGGGKGAEFTGDLIGRAKANPLPVALIGAGIAWLLLSDQRLAAGRRSRRTGYDDLEARIRTAEGSVHRYDDEHEEAFNSRLDTARGEVLGIERHPSDTAGSYRQRIKEALAGAADTLRRKSHDAQTGVGNAFAGLADSAGRGGLSIQEGTRKMSRSLRDSASTISTNPLALGALAAVAGIVAGSLIPTLEQEETLLGSAAGKLRATGRDLAQDVVDRGGRVAGDALTAIKESAQAQGFTGDPADAGNGDPADDAGQGTGEAMRDGRESAPVPFGQADRVA